jgi:hypothetical protein
MVEVKRFAIIAPWTSVVRGRTGCRNRRAGRARWSCRRSTRRSPGGELGKGLGRRATERIPAETLRAVNQALGRTVVTKYGTKRGAVALGRALPFGIGAAIGGGANYAFARAIAGHADRFFRDLPPALQARPG